MMANAWLVTSIGEASWSREYRGKLTSTTISTSTPMLRAMSMGRFSTSPPSTSRRPSRWRRREDAWRRNAGAHGRHEIACVHEHGFTGFEVRRHGTERNRQPIEILHVGNRQRRIAQHLLELLSLHQSLRQDEAILANTERIAHEKVAIVLLASKAEFGARRPILKSVLPIDRADQLFELDCRHA